PLRERKEDIVLLAEHLVRKSAEQMKKSVPEIPPEVLDLLTAYNYPGNVRELESILHEAVTLQKDGQISAAVVRNFMSENQMERGASAPEGLLTLSPGKFPTLKSAGEFLVQEALKRANQNQSLAAQMLGISRQALYLKLQGKKKADAEEE
ncbi:MAG: sigma-54-dependent Fis family transcriptional regulator, partial [Spirochaetia bacterium]|nr:sigma-54-dependent Fis family transcriptional regulator [Spirochaetia bacterium]